MQSFIAQADASAKGQAPIPQVPQQQQNRQNPNQNNYQPSNQNQGFAPPTQPQQPQPTTPPLNISNSSIVPPRSDSQNPFVNGTKV
jgi:hypothetical protein